MREILQSFRVAYDYPVVFTRNAFSPSNCTLTGVLARGGAPPQRILPVIDAGLLAADPGLPDRIESWAARSDLQLELIREPLIVRGGEICKRDPKEVREFHDLVAKHSLCRHSYALVIGGGAVLDAMGYAAATAHRGIRLIRMPSTSLAQNDAGIGVKNAVYFAGRKNFLGTFAPPFAVVNDFALLDSLDERDLCAGSAEAIKVSLIRDADFFRSLYEARHALARFDAPAMESMIVRCAELHLEHIQTSGDPFELGSARPLDFGHWAAHKLEELTGGSLRHGEAVAIGIAIDSLYSRRAGMIAEEELEQILALLEEVGFDLYHPALRTLEVERALSEFREHLGGKLCITLLKGIGSGIEVDHIDLPLMKSCVESLAQRSPRDRSPAAARGR
ncbi:MAG: 3-dehydroquinate synthase [Deltaproteobacteria bacterium]|nr:3-dehydroquinate synthase [Deltaproteobacteria bacterium]MBW2421123.1 3-dehydroquinate synthase [Deltaproteobacteria bacterium]